MTVITNEMRDFEELSCDSDNIVKNGNVGGEYITAVYSQDSNLLAQRIIVGDQTEYLFGEL